jgi:hypothetical protein
MTGPGCLPRPSYCESSRPCAWCPGPNRAMVDEQHENDGSPVTHLDFDLKPDPTDTCTSSPDCRCSSCVPF